MKGAKFEREKRRRRLELDLEGLESGPRINLRHRTACEAPNLAVEGDGVDELFATEEAGNGSIRG